VNIKTLMARILKVKEFHVKVLAGKVDNILIILLPRSRTPLRLNVCA
jgi:hypothetical protein